MDIMMPPLHEQPAPAPRLLQRDRVDAPRVICDAVGRNPNTHVDEINAELRKRDAELPGPLVAEGVEKNAGPERSGPALACCARRRRCWRCFSCVSRSNPP